MKLYIQITIFSILLSFVACTSDTSADAPVKEAPQAQETVTKTPNAVNSTSTTNGVVTANNTGSKIQERKSERKAAAKAIGGKKDGPAPELKVGNFTGSADPENAKKGINAGAAYKLGGQMGTRFCKCNEEELVNDCQSKVISSLETLKKTLHPKIAAACEKSFLYAKDNCK